jgi:ABC-type methionine transport system permease subunit
MGTIISLILLCIGIYVLGVLLNIYEYSEIYKDDVSRVIKIILKVLCFIPFSMFLVIVITLIILLICAFFEVTYNFFKD